MSRLARFEDYRFIGVRNTMIVYDCDDPGQFEALLSRPESDLVGANLCQAFAPDLLEEALNRGFSQPRR